MSVPPMGAMAAAFFSYDQVKRSFYMFFFQNPLADIAVAMNDLDFIARLWEDWSPGYPADDDLQHIRESLGDSANLGAALGYYRAMFDPEKQDPAYAEQQMATAQPTPQPTLYLHGANDGCIGAELTIGVEAHLPSEGSRFELVDDAGHFLQLEQPETVNRLILEFLAEA